MYRILDQSTMALSTSRKEAPARTRKPAAFALSLEPNAERFHAEPAAVTLLQSNAPALFPLPFHIRWTFLPA